MNQYLEVVRPKICVLVGLFVWIGSLVSGMASGASVFASALAAMMICAGGFVANDYLDRRKDAVFQRHKPLPSGRIDEKNAIYYFTSLFVSGFVVSTFVSPMAIMIAFIDILLLLLYSTHFRYYHVFGNFMVSAMYASAFLLGGAAANNIFPAMFLAMFVLFANTAKAILDDVTNLVRDRARGMRTIPILYGIAHSRMVSTIFMFAAIAVLPFPYYYGLYGKIFAVIAAASGIIFTYSIYLNTKNNKSEKVGYEITLAIVVGVLAFVTGSLV